MKYVEWVQKVFRVVVAESRAHPSSAGVTLQTLRVDADVPAQDEAEARQSLFDAIRDLVGMALIDPVVEKTRRLRLTQLGIAFAEQPLEGLWSSCFAGYLSPSQTKFLSALAGLCEVEGTDYAYLKRVSADQVFDRLGWSGEQEDAHDVALRLEEGGFLRRKAPLGVSPIVSPTYAGIVRAKERERSETHDLLQGLLLEGETANVEVKSRLAGLARRQVHERVTFHAARAESRITASRVQSN